MAAIGPLYSPAPWLLPNASQIPNLKSWPRTIHTSELIHHGPFFYFIRCNTHSCHVISSTHPSSIFPILLSPLLLQSGSKLSSFRPSVLLVIPFPSLRLEHFANSTPPSISALFLFPRQCLKPRQNPQRLPQRLRKHTPLTSNLSCLSFLRYPFHIQTRPTSISTHKPAVGISFVSRSSAATPLTWPWTGTNRTSKQSDHPSSWDQYPWSIWPTRNGPEATGNRVS